ncbi:MAG: acyltransferase family protein [Sarcina sp.]
MATVLIFSCHIFQFLENKLAWWLNIGVQLFFFLSGFLSSNSKEIGLKFLKKKLLRIYKSYWIFLVIVLPFYSVSTKITIKQIIIYFTGIQGFFINQSIKGLGHLWFITIIIVCYIIASILSMYKTYLKEISFLNKIFLIVIIYLTLIMICKNKYYLPWILVFIIGYFGRLIKDYNINKQTFIVNNLILIMSIILRVLIENNIFKNFEILGYNLIVWSKVIIGITLFIFLYFILRKNSNLKNNFIKKIEIYSYEIYLIHHVFILGYLSIMKITNNLIVNIFAVSLLSFILSILIVRIKELSIKNFAIYKIKIN